MAEEQKNVLSKPEVACNRTVHLFLDDRMFHIEAEWDWAMQVDELFCSQSLPTGSAFPGAAPCLIHPDDLDALRGQLEVMVLRSRAPMAFRVITLSGAVQQVSCQTAMNCADDASFIEGMRQEAFAEAEKQISRKQRNEQVLLKIYGHMEQARTSGIAYFNTATYECYYSDGVYQVHRLPPQTLNAHFHTFLPFVHPDERALVRDTLDRAYRQQSPVSIEYRLLLQGVHVHQVRLTTNWMFNDEGQLLMSSIWEEVTRELESEASLEQAARALQHEARINNMGELLTRSAHFRIDLETRITHYSDGIRLIYGLKLPHPPITAHYLQNYVHPDDQVRVRNANALLFREQKPMDLEFRIIRPDGKQRILRQRTTISSEYQGPSVLLGVIQDITDLRLLEQHARQYRSESEQYRRFLEEVETTAKIGSWHINLESGEIIWSAGMYALMGFKSEGTPLTQKAFLNYVHPEDKQEFTDRFTATIQGEENEFSFRVRHRSQILNLHAHFRREEKNGQAYFVAIVQDHSLRRQVENELFEQEQIANLLMDASPDRIVLTDSNNYILRWNRRCETDYGIRRDKAIGQNLFQLLPRLNQPEVIDWYKQVLDGVPVHVPYRRSLLTEDRHDLRLIPMPDEQGRIQAVLTVLRDVTREYELRQQLETRLQFIERMLEAIVDRIIMLDRNMTYRYWNRRAEEYYGVAKEEVIGRNILEVFPGLIDDPTYLEFRRALGGEMVHIPAGNTEEGKEYYETYLIPLKSESGEVMGILWIVHDLTAERHLARQQQKAERILNHINEAYYELDADLVIRYVNDRVLRIWNKEAGEVIGRNITEVFPGINGSAPLELVRKCVIDKVDVSGEFLSPVLKRWIYLSAVPYNGGAIVLFYDIHEVKEARQQVEASEALLREAEKLAQTGSYELDLASMELRFSDGMYHIFGVPPQSFQATLDEIDARSHPEDAAAVRDIIRKAIEQRTPYQYRRRIYRPDGSVRVVRSFGRVECSDTGEPLRLLGTARDVTEQEQANEERKKTEHLMQQTALATPDALTIYDLENSRPIYLNNCLGHWVGYSNEELMEMGFEGRLRLIHPDDQQMVLEFNRQMAASPVDYLGTIDYRIVSRTGRVLWIRNRSRIFLRNREGRGIQMLSVLQDVTTEITLRQNLILNERELRDLNQQLKLQNRMLEEKNEEITNFAFVASHDLKEPLRKIQTFSDWLIRHEPGLTSNGQDFLLRTIRSVRRMNALIDDVMVLTRIHSDRNRNEEVDLNAVLRQAKEELRYEIESRHGAVRSMTLPTIRANENQCLQLLKNLLSNALRFSRPGVEPLVSVSANGPEPASGEPWVLSVSDNGIGIDPKYHRKIFQVFQQLETGDGEGTGMGLAICRKIMENHGGAITVESEPGKGCTFSCSFPADIRIDANGRGDGGPA